MQRISRVAIMLMIGCVLAGAVGAGGRADLERTIFTVQGMHCDGCSATITATLKRVDGVEEASADHEKGIAEAVYRPREVDAEELKGEIEKLGYTVTGMETEAVES